MKTMLSNLLASHAITEWGVCRMADLPPLLECRAKSRIPQGAQRVLVCLFPYYVGKYPNRNVARYAMVDDYHTVCGGILSVVAKKLTELFPEDAFEPFVDNSPIPEKPAAVLAGLGVQGWNSQLINPVYGSFAFIGTIVTTLELPVSASSQGSCLGCGLCRKACPTGCLSENGFERPLCRSHITQKKKNLSPWEEEQIRQGGFVWGCDICLEVCPMNHSRPLSPISAFYRDISPILTPQEMPRLVPQKSYCYRGEDVLLRNYRLIYGDNIKQE